MKITPVEFDLPLDDGEGRTKGVHVSDVIRVLALRFGYLKPEYEDAELNPEIIGLGCAFEDWVCKRHKEMLYHPGEVEKDKIYLTCDGVSYTGPAKALRVHEIKLTWKSSSKPLEDEWMWITQLMAYCKAWGTTYGAIHHYHVMADYKRNFSARRYFVHNVEFTQSEINRNWDMILQGRKYLKEGGKDARVDNSNRKTTFRSPRIPYPIGRYGRRVA